VGTILPLKGSNLVNAPITEVKVVDRHNLDDATAVFRAAVSKTLHPGPVGSWDGNEAAVRAMNGQGGVILASCLQGLVSQALL
jgi:hypothetical protein